MVARAKKGRAWLPRAVARSHHQSQSPARSRRSLCRARRATSRSRRWPSGNARAPTPSAALSSQTAASPCRGGMGVSIGTVAPSSSGTAGRDQVATGKCQHRARSRRVLISRLPGARGAGPSTPEPHAGTRDGSGSLWHPSASPTPHPVRQIHETNVPGATLDTGAGRAGCAPALRPPGRLFVLPERCSYFYRDAGAFLAAAFPQLGPDLCVQKGLDANIP